jgi:hypothetical protein
MNETTKQIIISRLKSFAWRLGGYIIVSLLAWLVDTLTAIGIDPTIITIVALVVGEITKFVNVNLPEIRANK